MESKKNQDYKLKKLDMETEQLSIEGELETEDYKVEDVNLDNKIQSNSNFENGENIDNNYFNYDNSISDSNYDNSISDSNYDDSILDSNYDNSISDFDDDDNIEDSSTEGDISKDNRSLKQRAQDTKQNLKDSRDKIKNAPENLRNKKEQVKNAWNNRPKNMNDVKDKIKNGAKNNAKKIANKAENGIKEGFKKSDIGQAIDKGKKAIDNGKKAVKVAKKTGKAVAKGAKAAAKAVKGLIDLIVATLPWSAIIIGVVLLIFLIIVLISALLPGVGGDVNDSDNISNYSKTDQKVIEKIQKSFKKYSNADGALAMAVVLYPYYETLHDGEVESYLYSATDEEPEDVDDTIADESDDNNEDSNDDDKDDVEEDEEDNDYEENDIYLVPLRKYSVRKKLSTVLKKLNSLSESEFNDYLKDEYFKKDKGYLGYDGDAYNGYKEMFDSIPSDQRDDFADAVIKDLYEKKDLFIDYVYQASVCTSSATTLTYSDGTDLIKGEAYVVLKDSSSTDFSDIYAASSSYGTDDYHLSLKRYVMGVAYGEVGEWIYDEEFAKVAMIAAKSLVLGRNSSSSSGMNYKPDYIDGKTIFYMRNNTYDQGFCDIYEGCQSGSKYDHSLIKNDPTGEMKKNTKASLSSDKIALLEQWYDETASKFVYDSESNGYYAAYLSDSYGEFCPQGGCLLQTRAYEDAKNGSGYEAILKKYYSDNKYVIKDIETNTLSQVSLNCTAVSAEGCTVPSDQFVFYSQRNYTNNFCGRTDATISSSGCGVTSMAMILANLVDSTITPIETMNDAFSGGYCGTGISGTNSAYFKVAAQKYNLNYDTVAASDNSEAADKKIIETLNSGGLIIANVAGSQTCGTGKPWSTVTQGHYLVVKGITLDNKLIIADPMSTDLNNPWKNNITLEDMRTYMNDRIFHLFTGGKSNEIKEKYCASGVATGYLGNPFNLNDTSRDFMLEGNAECFPYYCSGSAHGAVDIPVSEDTPVYAMDGGTVETSVYHNSWGEYVVINHGNGYKTLYAHFNERMVNEGDNVSKGQQIGLSGSTGNSTGPHLHIELQSPSYSYLSRGLAKRGLTKGLMNAAEYINKDKSYVGNE